MDHFAIKVGRTTCGTRAVLTVRIPGRGVFCPRGASYSAFSCAPPSLALAVFCYRGTTCCSTTFLRTVVKLLGQCHRDQQPLVFGPRAESSLPASAGRARDATKLNAHGNHWRQRKRGPHTVAMVAP